MEAENKIEVQESVENQSKDEVLIEKKVKKVKINTLILIIAQIVIMFIPIIETQFGRRSLINLASRVPNAILNLSVRGIGQYRTGTSDYQELMNLLLLVVALFTVLLIIVTVLTLITLILRKTSLSKKLMTFLLLLVILMNVLVIGSTVFTVMNTEYSGDNYLHFMMSLSPILFLDVFYLVISVSLIATYLQKSTFIWNKFSMIRYAIVAAILIVAILNTGKLRMAYMYEDEIYRTSAVVMGNGDVQSTYEIFMSDKDDFEELEDQIDDILDNADDRLDDMDVDVDWSIKRNIFGKVTLNILWEDVLENNEFYDYTYKQMGFGTGFGYQMNAVLQSLAAGFVLEEEFLDQDHIKNSFVINTFNINKNKTITKREYKELEDMIIVYPMTQYVTFDGVVPKYVQSIRQEKECIDLGGGSYFTYRRAGFIVDND